MGFVDELLFTLAIAGELFGIPLGMIAHKAGHSWANGLFAFVPFGFLLAVGMPPDGRWRTGAVRATVGGR